MKHLNWAIVLVLALTLLAFGLRVYRVEAMSVWTDEGLSIYRARAPLLQNLTGRIDIQGVPTTDTHPPLYFLMLSGWSKITGETEFALRLLSVIAGTLIVPLAYVTGKRLWSREVGVWFAALIATAPFYWWHARDARMYTWLAVWTLLSVYLTSSSVQSNPMSRRRFILGLVCVTAMALTHYTGVILAVLLASAVFTALWRRQRRWAIATLLALVIIAVPTLVFAASRLRVAEFPEYRPLQEMLFETWNIFSLGLSREQMRPLEWLIIFPLLGVLGAIGLAAQCRWGRLLFIGLWLFAPLIAFYLISLIKPAYVNPRNLSIALPAFLLLIAGGLAVLRRIGWPLAAIACAAVLIEYGAATIQQVTDPNLMKDDVRSLVRHIRSNYQPGDAVVLHDAIIQLAFDYYAAGALPVTAVPRYGTYADPQAAARDLQHIADRSERLWFVASPAPIGFPEDLLPDWLGQHTYRLSGASFRGNYTGAYVNLVRTHTPILDRLPESAQVLVARAPEIALGGFDVPTRMWPADQPLVVKTYWQATDRMEPLTLVLELLDAQNNIWARRDRKLWQYYPRDQWPRDRLVEWETTLLSPLGIPPGTYYLRLRLVQPDSGAAVNFDQADDAGYVSLGKIDLGRPTQPWDRAALTTGIPVDVSIGEALQMWAIVPPSDVIRPGLTFALDLIWQATRALKEDYRFNLDVLTPDGRVLQTIEQANVGGAFTTAQWRAGDVVREGIIISIPANAPSGDYPLRLQVFDLQGRPLANRMQIGTLHVEEYPLQTAVPPLQIDRRAQFSEPIELLGANLSAGPNHAGGRLAVNLIWRAAGQPTADYTVFVHLLDSKGMPVGQGDGDPVSGLRLTSSWRPGEVIADRHTIPLHINLLPGEYTLYTGLYQRATGDRVAVTVDGAQSPERWIKLGTVTIAP
ncbi:hypothetical protein TFLX_03569 [Thermoflexales bacterium]|nr:hypothetical protein TFLX_03569 [Thermoflexales bacterium]